MLVNICDIQSVLKAKTKLVRGMEDQVSRLAAGESFLFSGHESSNSLSRSISIPRNNICRLIKTTQPSILLYQDNQQNIKNVSTKETMGEKLAMRLPPGTDDFDQETSAMNFHEVVSQIKTMKRQEDGPYKCSDSITKLQSENTRISGTNNRKRSRKCNGVDTLYRAKMIEYFYRIVDFFELQRDIVSVTINILDRYSLTAEGSSIIDNRKEYQLASMASFYTSIKIFESKVIGPDFFTNTSRGSFTEKDITDMEMRILLSLKWRMNPPTALAFVHNFMHLIPNDMNKSVRLKILEHSKYQTELAMNDCWFADKLPSSIALASITNSFNALECRELSETSRTLVLNAISLVLRTDGPSAERNMMKDKLAQHYMKNTTSQLDVSLTPDISLSKKTIMDSTEWESAKIASYPRQNSRRDPLMRSRLDHMRIFKRT